MDWRRLMDPAILSLLIPIVAIIMVFGLVITKAVIRHRERMAMIERGLNPDSPQQNVNPRP